MPSSPLVPRIIAAPLGGGPSTPALVAAVARAGGFGFLAGGYLSAAALERDLVELDRLGAPPSGVNLFVPGAPTADLAAAHAYAERIRPVADAARVALGPLAWDDDAFDEKVETVLRHRARVVTFTFGLPPRAVRDRLRGREILVGATITTPDEAVLAVELGVDLLVAQGAEAGGHRAAFHDDPSMPGGGELVERRELVRRVRAMTDLPIVAAGGVADGADIAESIADGAVAAQLGTAFLCCPESGTSSTHRTAILEQRYDDTIVTRAFTGRPARGLRNGFADRFHVGAPSAYPEIHHLTRPLRRHAAEHGDPDALHLWAGTRWRAATAEPAGQLVARLSRELAERGL